MYVNAAFFQASALVQSSDACTQRLSDTRTPAPKGGVQPKQHWLMGDATGWDKDDPAAVSCRRRRVFQSKLVNLRPQGNLHFGTKKNKKGPVEGATPNVVVVFAEQVQVFVLALTSLWLYKQGTAVRCHRKSDGKKWNRAPVCTSHV